MNGIGCVHTKCNHVFYLKFDVYTECIYAFSQASLQHIYSLSVNALQVNICTNKAVWEWDNVLFTLEISHVFTLCDVGTRIPYIETFSTVNIVLRLLHLCECTTG